MAKIIKPLIIKPLSPMQVKNAKSKDKPYNLFDGGELRLQVSKDSKYWRMDYRFESKRNTLSFGKYPEVSLEQARKLIANGIDPSQAKKAQKAANKEHTANSFETASRIWHEKRT